MLHAGLDLGRRKLDVCLLNDRGDSSTGSSSRLTSTRCERSRDESTTFTRSRSAPSSSR
jgi:hypothetical protein